MLLPPLPSEGWERAGVRAAAPDRLEKRSKMDLPSPGIAAASSPAPASPIPNSILAGKRSERLRGVTGVFDV